MSTLTIGVLLFIFMLVLMAIRVPIAVAINHFVSDTDAEVQAVIDGARQSGNHVVLTLSEGSTVTLRDTRLNQLDMGDFLF